MSLNINVAIIFIVHISLHPFCTYRHYTHNYVVSLCFPSFCWMV